MKKLTMKLIAGVKNGKEVYINRAFDVAEAADNGSLKGCAEALKELFEYELKQTSVTVVTVID